MAGWDNIAITLTGVSSVEQLRQGRHGQRHRAGARNEIQMVSGRAAQVPGPQAGVQDCAEKRRE